MARAKQHYQTGLALVDQLRFFEAASQFEMAYQAYPDPVYLYNAGRAYQLGGEVEKAIAAFRRYLLLVPDSPDRAKVEGWIEECEVVYRERMGELRVTVSPEQARVFVDGVEHRAPVKILIAPGEHEVVVEATEHETAVRKVVVEPGRSALVDVALKESPRAAFKVQANVSGAAVFVNGLLVGRTPLEVPRAEPGPIRLRVEADGFRPFEVSETLSEGETLTVNAELVPIPKEPEKKLPSRGSVVWRSLVFPGWGHLHGGHKTGGAFYMAGEAALLGGLTGTLVTRSYYLGKRNSERDPVRWSALNDRVSAWQWSAIAIGAGAAILWIVNIVHAATMDLE